MTTILRPDVGSKQSRQKHAQDRDDSTNRECLDELEAHLVEVSKSPALRDPGSGGPAALICSKLWRASQLIKNSSLPTAAAANEAKTAGVPFRVLPHRPRGSGR